MLIVAALYHFTRFPDPAAIKPALARVCCGNGVKGSLLLAPEGVNGTIAGTRAGIDAVLAHLRALPGCADLTWKEARADTMPFGRMKVRLKREIVTMLQPDVDPRARTGHYVDPADWNAVVRDPDTVLIDTRNAYEVAIGTFPGAVDPGTESFSQFPAWWQENRHRFAGKRVAMFCTGGIRCEKSTNYLLGQGVNEVLHLRGGILQYLADVPADDSLWQGGCFVFDQRVAVGVGLEPTGHVLCHACRRPLDAADTARPDYEEGVQCRHCVDEFTPERRAGFRERQRQIALARARGVPHLGAAFGDPEGQD